MSLSFADKETHFFFSKEEEKQLFMTCTLRYPLIVASKGKRKGKPRKKSNPYCTRLVHARAPAEKEETGEPAFICCFPSVLPFHLAWPERQRAIL
jgi:hypothetical protein